MAKTQIEVGAVYRANVGGKKIEVRIEREIWKGEKHSGWGGINLATNRPTTIKAGTKMTRVEEAPATEPAAPKPAVAPKGGKKGKAAVPAATEPAATGANVANDAGGEPAAGAEGVIAEPKAPKGQKRGGKGGKAASADTKHAAKPKPASPRKPGILDLAAGVLAKAKAPMTCTAIVEAVLAEKMWFTQGKTPAATLYSAITREISAKGKDSRFVKADRGLFKANTNGA